MIRKRVEQIQNLLGNSEAALISSIPNRFYLTGFESSDGFVVITKNYAVFLVDFRYVEKAKEDSGFNVEFNVTPHVFRHSKAVHMVRAGINLIYIRDFLGHVDCCTTEIYARIDTEIKRNAIEKACKDIFPKERTTDWTADEDLMSFLETLV